jgi:hypothetical protein
MDLLNSMSSGSKDYSTITGSKDVSFLDSKDEYDCVRHSSTSSVPAHGPGGGGTLEAKVLIIHLCHAMQCSAM